MSKPNRTLPSMSKLAEAFSYNDKVDKTAVASVIRTEDELIMGYLHVRPIVRMLDELLNAEKFIAVTDATVFDGEGNTLFRTKFMAVNRESVVYIIPREEIIDSEVQTTSGKTLLGKRALVK